MAVPPAIVINGPVTASRSYVLSKLKSLDLKDKTSSELQEAEFDIGDIDSSKYGKTKLKGTLPLLGPYIKPNLENLTKVEAILEARVRELRVPWDDDEISGESSNTKVALLSAAYFNNQDDIEEPGMLAMSFFFLCIIYIDDILDRSGSFGGFKGAGDFSARFLDQAMNVFKGEFNTLNDIPPMIPSLDPIMKLGFVSYEYASKGIPNFPEKSCHLRKSLEKDAMAGLLMKEKGFGDKYSDETYRMLRARDGGFCAVLEMILLVRGIQVPPKVRKSMLFRVLVENAAGSLSLVNDLLGLKKEIRDEEMDNLVLRKIESEKLSLDVSFAQVNQLVVKQRRDVALICETLVKEYPEDEQIFQLISAVKTLLDGHVYFSVYGKRYGDIGFKLI